MKRKIFKKSDKSRIRSNLEFAACYWWVRSTASRSNDYVSCVIFNGYVDSYYTINYNGVLPACMI